MAFSEWINTFVVDRKHLDKVIQYDLDSGIKKMLDDVWVKTQNIPVCVFHGKPTNKYYVYHKEPYHAPQWVLMHNDFFDKCIQHIRKLFVKEMLVWYNEINTGLNEEEMTKCITVFDRVNTKDPKQTIRSWFLTKVVKQTSVVQQPIIIDN